ncbi:MAG: T9SS type B sorting domain-containing protein [Chlorobi bacterium]|nr:T9SS type B sorting domain-containing protein [Chlorobiota bacterium]
MKTLKLTFLICFYLFPIVGFSQTVNTWTGAGDGTSYNNSSNWSSGLTPLSSDTIIFDNVNVTITNIPIISINLAGIKIINNSNVTFESSANTINFNCQNMIVDASSTFALSGSTAINVSFSDAFVEGTIDAGDIHQFNGVIDFEENSVVETANSGGFESSISGNISFADLSTFTINYYGNSVQNTGLLNGAIDSIGTIITDNPYTVNLDRNIKVKNLVLNDGIFNLDGYTLTLNGNCSFTSGVLAGNSTSSLNIIGVGSGDAMHIEFDPAYAVLRYLTIDRPNDEIVTVNSILTISNGLTVNGGKLRINNMLTMPATATITTATSINYIITGDYGVLNKSIAVGNDVKLPVGTEDYYAPVTINTVSADNYQISVHDSIYSNGNFGIPLTKQNVNLRWKIIPASNTQFDLTLAWNPAAQNGAFDFSNSYISNYNGTEWNNLGLTNYSTGSLNSLSLYSVSSEGLFGVFSGTNNLPAAADNEITAAMNTAYIFSPEDFNYSDIDGDAFAKIMINEIPLTGVLFLDYNENFMVDNGEEIQAGDQINIHQISNQLLKFAPITDDFGSPYTTFTFSVSDGTNYSIYSYIMTVNVTDNVPPAAQDQTFTVPEHSPNGTTVGKIIASDSNADQTLSFYPVENGVIYSDAFSLALDGTITVSNSDLLEYSIHPEFNYLVNVCDDGTPTLCTPITITINLSEVIRNLVAANFISPNGDGHNDRWLVKGLENGIYEAFIFNSSGKLLFHSADYKNGWDGTSRGKELPAGVYYYLLKSPDTELKGTITLVR